MPDLRTVGCPSSVVVCFGVGRLVGYSRLLVRSKIEGKYENNDVGYIRISR